MSQIQEQSVANEKDKETISLLQALERNTVLLAPLF